MNKKNNTIKLFLLSLTLSAVMPSWGGHITNQINAVNINNNSNSNINFPFLSSQENEIYEAKDCSLEPIINLYLGLQQYLRRVYYNKKRIFINCDGHYKIPLQSEYHSIDQISEEFDLYSSFLSKIKKNILPLQENQDRLSESLAKLLQDNKSLILNINSLNSRQMIFKLFDFYEKNPSITTPCYGLDQVYYVKYRLLKLQEVTQAQEYDYMLSKVYNQDDFVQKCMHYLDENSYNDTDSVLNLYHTISELLRELTNKKNSKLKNNKYLRIFQLFIMKECVEGLVRRLNISPKNLKIELKEAIKYKKFDNVRTIIRTVIGKAYGRFKSLRQLIIIVIKALHSLQ